MKISGSIIFLLSIVFFVCAVDDDVDLHAPVRARCRDELGLTDEALKDAISDPRNMACYLYCFLMELDVMDLMGNFDPEAALQSMHESLQDAAKPDIYACYEQSKQSLEDEPCLRAYNVVKCFQTRAPNLYEMLGIFRPPAMK